MSYIWFLMTFKANEAKPALVSSAHEKTSWEIMPGKNGTVRFTQAFVDQTLKNYLLI